MVRKKEREGSKEARVPERKLGKAAKIMLAEELRKSFDERLQD